MNDLELATKLIADKNNSLKELSKKTGIPYQSLRNYRSHLSQLKKASWERVHLLAKLAKK